MATVLAIAVLPRWTRRSSERSRRRAASRKAKRITPATSRTTEKRQQRQVALADSTAEVADEPATTATSDRSQKAPCTGPFVLCIEEKLASRDVYTGAFGGAAVKAGLAYQAEGDYAVLECKKGVVFAKADIRPRHHAGAALADNNVAALGALPGIELNAQIFGF